MHRESARGIAAPAGDEPGGRPLPDWLREKLFERRIVLLTGPLDASAAGETAAALTGLDVAGDEPIVLHVDSPDGTLEAAFVLVDVIEALHAPVHVHCRGRVGGPVIGVLAAGARRVAAPHTRFRLGQPTARFAGTPEEIAEQSRLQQMLLWRLYARLAAVTGRPAEEIAEDMRRGRHLDAREALEYGLVESIAVR